MIIAQCLAIILGKIYSRADGPPAALVTSRGAGYRRTNKHLARVWNEGVDPIRKKYGFEYIQTVSKRF